MINIDKYYYMKTINSTVEGYLHSYRIPCVRYCSTTGLISCMLQSQVQPARYGTEDFC